MPHEVQKFVVIMPSTDTAPPPNADTLTAMLEACFPGYGFTVISSGQIKLDDDQEPDGLPLGLDEISVLPMMKMGTFSSPPAEPPFELIAEIQQHLRAIGAAPPRPN